MADFDYEAVRELKAWLESMAAAKSVLDTIADISQPEPVDEAAIKTSCRNQILAGSGDKRAFWGDLQNPPTVTSAVLQAHGLKAAAADTIIEKRDQVRTLLLKLI